MLITRKNFSIHAANYTATLMDPDDVCHKISANFRMDIDRSELENIHNWCLNAKPDESLTMGPVTVTAKLKTIII